MKKIFTLAIVSLAALLSSNAYAQDVKKFTIGIGLEGALPVGGLKNAYSVGAGATVRAAFGVTDNSAVTLTSGAIAFIPKDLSIGGQNVDLKAQINIPVKAGYKYFFSDNFYGIGEAGMSFIKTYVPNGAGGTTSVSGSEFTYAPGVGAQFGGFDASLRYEGYSGAGFLGLRLGFNF
ncbi:hypothetical protein DJ568_07245 [Mucilaginibacter hurinus]|uniref:Outer membrane protein beta-barrel domain-containing protein n=1 Tax=Mucilaginibacter hurinus TaxID=2201324 RepID=A0A367GRG0_9SPHI|nr:outer membrane beta-barrel protein [Mucilaginibacter hurinus]RCH55675.1 hypothetical protein DJ568_07245 [Mucilaginibacter hurinus]